MGDFNLPTLDWSLENVMDKYISPRDQQFYDCFCTLGLTQWIKEPTFISSGNILDLILTSGEDRLCEVGNAPPLPGCSHCPVYCSYVFRLDFGQQVMKSTKLWYKGNYRVMRELLSDVNWTLEFDNCSANVMYYKFLSTISTLAERLIPVRNTRPLPRWLAPAPSNLMQERTQAWKRYKSLRAALGRQHDQCQNALDIFTNLNFRYRHYTYLVRISYEEELIRDLDNAPRLFHSYIRRQKIGCPSVGPLQLPSGDWATTPAAISEELARTFASVFRVSHHAQIYPHQALTATMQPLTISREGVEKKIRILDGSKSSDPDGIHPFMLKSCAQEVSWPLYLIFNESIRSGDVPEKWKKSSVIPTFKGGSRSDPTKYRPIRLTSLCCRTMERLVADHIVN